MSDNKWRFSFASESSLHVICCLVLEIQEVIYSRTIQCTLHYVALIFHCAQKLVKEKEYCDYVRRWEWGENNSVKVCANHNESERFPVKSVVLNLSKLLWESTASIWENIYSRNTLVHTFIHRNKYLHLYTQIDI